MTVIHGKCLPCVNKFVPGMFTLRRWGFEPDFLKYLPSVTHHTREFQYNLRHSGHCLTIITHCWILLNMSYLFTTVNLRRREKGWKIAELFRK
mgnify:CR=1 FL=1